MKKNNSNLFPLLTGLLVGGAAIYFLKSEKGQQMVDLALKKGEELKSDIVVNSKEMISASKDALNDALQTGENKFSQIAESVKETANEKLSEFEKGVNAAKKKIAKA